MKKLDKFLRSKIGKLAVGALLLLIVVAVVVSGGLNGEGLSGTAGIPTYPSYPMPAGGYTCLPTCIENDAKMFILAGINQASMSNAPVKVWVMVPGDQPTFTLGIFDGDTGKAVNNSLYFFDDGRINPGVGNWDSSYNADTTYTLYADPLADGSGQISLASWLGNDVMLNNAWWETTINRDEKAKAPNGHYYYRLEATRSLNGVGGQAFKVRASGYLMTGQRPEWAVGLSGTLAAANDLQIIYPESNGNPFNLGSVLTYDGDWQMYFEVPAGVEKIEVWDGDFDRGNGSSALDTDDPNTIGKPIWSTISTVDEGVGGTNQDGIGNPMEDNPSSFKRVSPAAYYEILDPAGQVIYSNDSPSGTEEWEKFSVSSNPVDSPDVLNDLSLEPGMYNLHIKGLDLQNAIWIGVNYPICDPNGGCPPPVWVEETCPRPIGYWKKAINTVYIKNKNYKLHESKVTLDWGLRNVALASKLYRSGIILSSPVAIENPVPLTGAEADKIMQKKGSGSPLLKQALQRNLAAWMNLGIGKIGPYSQIEITGITGGDFSGTMIEALRFSDEVLLDPSKRSDVNLLKRVKEIAEWINNNNLTTDAGEENESLACSDFARGTFPEGEQPPKHDDLPKAPKPDPDPVTPEPITTAEVPACRAEDLNYGLGYAIIALNPNACLGEQNGLLFHGTSSTTISSAFSNGCLRSVGTHSVLGVVDYAGENFGDMTLINPAPIKVENQLPESAWQIEAPNCSDPAAIQMDGKDFKGDLLLQPGLYCINGDATINASDHIAGDGVTLYFTDGKFTINGGATVNLSAPQGSSVSPALPGVLVYLPLSNSNPVLIDGNSESWYQGTIYAPASEINILGTGQVHGGWAQFIGWDVQVGGTADIFIDYLDRDLPVCTP